MKQMRKAAAVGAIAGVSMIVSLPAMDDQQPAASTAVHQPPPADGSPGAMSQGRESGGQVGSESAQHSPQSGYSEWETSPNGGWTEPVYGGWSPEPSGQGWNSEPSGQGWGREPSATGEAGSQGQRGAPRSPSTASPAQSGSQWPVAASPGRLMVDPWVTTDQGTDPQPAGQATEPPSTSTAESSSGTEQPSGTANYPMRPLPPPVGAPPPAYGSYPGYGAGAPPPPPPGWGYGYPAYGGPPGPYGAPGVARGSNEGGWPWGNMMPWGNRGGGNAPWGDWMPWGK